MYTVFITTQGSTPTSRAIMAPRDYHDLKQDCDYARERVGNSDPSSMCDAVVKKKNTLKFHAWLDEAGQPREHAFV
jgi:hypothetical protein